LPLSKKISQGAAKVQLCPDDSFVNYITWFANSIPSFYQTSIDVKADCRDNVYFKTKWKP